MSKQFGEFPNGFYLEPSKTIGGLPEVVHTDTNKQNSFPIYCRNLSGGSRRRKKKRKTRKKYKKSRSRKVTRSLRGGKSRKRKTKRRRRRSRK